MIFVGDRSDLPEGFDFDLARWSRRMPTTIFDAAEPGRYFGLDIYRGPGRSGNRNTLYYSTGNEYTRFPAKEPPGHATGLWRARLRYRSGHLKPR